MKDAVIAIQTAFPDHTALKRAVVGCAIEIPILRLKRPFRVISRADRRAVKSRERAIGCQLEHYAVSRRSAEKGRAIEIAVSGSQQGMRVTPIRAIERRQRSEVAVRHNLEDCPAFPKPAAFSRAVEAAIIAANQDIGIAAIGIVEMMDGRESSTGR